MNPNPYFKSIIDQDREAVMRSLEKAYWLAKEDNQKYTPKKYRK